MVYHVKWFFMLVISPFTWIVDGQGGEANILSQIITFCIEFLVAFLCCCLVLLENSLFE